MISSLIELNENLQKNFYKFEHKLMLKGLVL